MECIRESNAASAKKLAEKLRRITPDNYATLRSYGRKHPIYTQLVATIKTPTKRRNEKERFYQFIQRNTGAIESYLDLTSAVCSTIEEQDCEDLDHVNRRPPSQGTNEFIEKVAHQQNTPVKNILPVATNAALVSSTPDETLSKNKISSADAVAKMQDLFFSPIKTEELCEHETDVFASQAVSNTEQDIKSDLLQQCRSRTPSDCDSTRNISREIIDIPEELVNLTIVKDKQILPKGAVNEEPGTRESRTIRNKYDTCNVLEGEFCIPERKWNSICSGKKFNTRNYTYYLKNRISNYVNNTCIINFRRVVYAKNGITVFAYCPHNHKNCKNFKIVITENSVHNGTRIAKVFSTSLNYCHPYMLTAHVRGIKRDLFKNELLSTKPLLFKQQTILNMDRNILKKAENLQDVKSEPTIRRIRSDMLNSLKRADDDEIDMLLMRREHPEYIKYFGTPLNVKVFSIEQLEILHHANEGILHFDATGTVVRANESSSPKILYYCGVVSLKNPAVLCPVFEMISSEHDPSTIHDLFEKFKRFCKKEGHLLTFQVFVTDFSYTNIYAACFAFHRSTLEKYLESAFQIVQLGKKLPRDFKIIMLCCAHFMKNICEFINKVVQNLQAKSALKEMVACAFSIKTMEEATDWFTYLVIILNSVDQNEVLKHALLQLGKFIAKSSTATVLDYDEIITTCSHAFDRLTDDNENAHRKRELRKNSPFFKYFDNVYQKLMSQHAPIFSGPIHNIYYCPSLANTMLERYMPFLCMWTQLLLVLLRNKNITRVSNNPIERYFGILKNDLLENKKYLRPSNFVRKSREYVISTHDQLRFNIGKTGLTRAPKIKDIDSIPDVPTKRTCDEEDKVSVTSTESNVEEQWERKPKRKAHSYFNARHLKRRLFPPLSTIEEVSEIKMTSDLDESKPRLIEKNIDCSEENESATATVRDTCESKPICCPPESIVFLDNGLIENIDYYKQANSSGFEYVVASFANSEHKYMSSFHFDCLTGPPNSALQMATVDMVCSVFLKKYNIRKESIWSVKKATSAVHFNEKLNQMPSLTNVTYMPIYDEKWLLLKIDQTQKEILLYDPAEGTEVECRKYLRNCQLFFVTYNCNKQFYVNHKDIDDSCWQCHMLKNATSQEQLHQSALLILWVINQALQGKSLSDEMNPNHFAESIQMDLLAYSDDMRNVCLVCGRCDVDYTAKWVECSKCERWLHQCCDKRSFGDLTSFSSSLVTYYCFLCCRYFELQCEEQNSTSATVNGTHGTQYKFSLSKTDMAVLRGQTDNRYFSDSIINRFGEIWNKHNEDFYPLQDVLRGIFPGELQHVDPVPKHRKNVQILYVGSPSTLENPNSVGHWICSYYDGENVHLYNSLNSFQLNENAMQFLTALYPYNPMIVRHPKAQQQMDAFSCGMFAIAFAVSIMFNEDPETRAYSEHKLLSHCCEIIELGKITNFP